MQQLPRLVAENSTSSTAPTNRRPPHLEHAVRPQRDAHALLVLAAWSGG
jgi:hypothetical protein